MDRELIRRALGTTTEIADFDMGEFSGVDHGANLVDGWAVMKSEGQEDLVDLSELIQAEEVWIEKADSLFPALTNFDWDSAPTNVQAAAKVLIGFLQAEGTGGAGPGDGTRVGQTDGIDGAVMKSGPQPGDPPDGPDSTSLRDRILQRLGIKKSDDQLDAEAVAKHWDSFCSDIEGALAARGQGATVVKQLLSDSVFDLQTRVYAERGFISKAVWTAAKRREAAKNGHARPDGSFPVEDSSDISDAAHLIDTGHGGPEDKAHIVRQAKRLGVPSPWKQNADQ